MLYILPNKDYYSDSKSMLLEFWRMVGQWLAAIGSIAVAILAIFGESIKRFFNNPKLRITFNCDKIHVREKLIESESEDIKKIKEIYLKIENIRSNKAADCQVFVDEIYKKIENSEEFTGEKLESSPLLWTDRLNKKDILKLIPHYIKICEFRQIYTFLKEDPKSQTIQEDPYFELTLGIRDPKKEEGNYTLKNGKYIIGIIVYSSSMRKPIRYYLDLYWNGVNHDDFIVEKFGITLMSKIEFNTKIKPKIKN